MSQVTLLPGEQEKIDAALEALAKDPHAPREISVRVAIHIHNEYPKFVGEKIVNSAEEEEAERVAIAAKAESEKAEVV